MVDFKKRLTGRTSDKQIDPVKLYDTLDRAHDKGPLRPAQVAVLAEWFANHQGTRDNIVKLHTGQGKTLIGLLMLQARLNAGKGPSLYLCPDNYLIDQTCDQARQFGIATCKASPELPEEFLNSNTILVASVQKLFNGLTKFGLNRQSVAVGSMLLDDAHACSDIIREACRIRIPREEPAYHALRTLFASDLEAQGVGTFADLCNHQRDALLPVPYWAWLPRESEVARILSEHSKRDSVKFAWPLLKDILGHCQCVFSGTALEIEPYIAPLSAFGSYWESSHRIFMSATVTDDAFLVKGLQLKPETITRPLSYAKETWSGEKMVLLPSLIHESLDRETIVKGFAGPMPKRRNGLVCLAPSFNRTRDWVGYGASATDKDTVSGAIDSLKKGHYEKAVVLVNRYDGIDLPDESCRILVFDSKPYSESLIDLYQELCRPDSDATLMRTIRTVEQGMGRSVRGEKDYSAIVIIGPDIIRLVREKSTRRYLSPQTAAQIEIGLDIADMARQEIDAGRAPADAFNGVLNQCLGRDDGWKAFYVEQMDKVTPAGANAVILNLYATELVAEQAYNAGDYATAGKTIQSMLDGGTVNQADKGWYLQEMARYYYQADRQESQRLQVAAHKNNHMLLRPPSGVTVAKLTVISQGRVERIAEWVRELGTYSDLDIRITDILNSLVFGTKADKFEHALDELSRALGFAGERPDKQWKEGPDNLWAMDDTQYLLWECKSEVDVTRAEIDKREAEQMNRSSAWFEKHYQGLNVKRILIHPSNTVQSAAAFTHEVEATRVAELRSIVKSVREFFKSFETQNFKDLSARHVQQMIDAHRLTVEDFLKNYSKKLRHLK
ncbi:DEAD/DEAH box helicase family protein [Singulisphaera rosea]